MAQLPEPYHSDPNFKPYFAPNPVSNQWLSGPFWIAESGRRWGTGSWVRWKWADTGKKDAQGNPINCLYLFTDFSYDAHFNPIWGCRINQTECAYRFAYTAPYKSFCDVDPGQYSVSCPAPIYSDPEPCPESVPLGRPFQAISILLNEAEFDAAPFGCLKPPSRVYTDMVGTFECEMQAYIDTGAVGTVAQGTLTYTLPGCPPTTKTCGFKTGKRKGGGLEDGRYRIPITPQKRGDRSFGSLGSDASRRWSTPSVGAAPSGEPIYSDKGQIRTNILIHPDGGDDGTYGCIGLDQAEAVAKNVKGDLDYLASIGVDSADLTVVTGPGVIRTVGKTLPGIGPVSFWQTRVGPFGTIIKPPTLGQPPKVNDRPGIFTPLSPVPPNYTI
jgi:hypothetical protein